MRRFVIPFAFLIISTVLYVRDARHAGGAGQGSPDTHCITHQYHDVAYASASPAEKLDLHLPNDGANPYPVIVAIHGGAFLFGDKTDAQQVGAMTFVHNGYAVATINYRMADEATFPAAIEDAEAAIRFLRANAARYHLDPNRVIAWGGSAGAYIAAMLGTTGNTENLQLANATGENQNTSDATRQHANDSLGNPGQSSAVQAVVDWFGPIDFAAMDAQFRASGKGAADHDIAGSPESRFLGMAVDTAPPALLKAANPAIYAGKDLPPFLIEHGDADSVVPVEQSVNFARALNAIKPGVAQLVILPGAKHADPVFAEPANLDRVLAFLRGIHRK